MKLSGFKYVTAFMLGISALCGELFAQELKVQEINAYDKRVEKYAERWNRLIPRHLKMQYAGSMGLLSAGPGWSYGRKDQWETDLMFGFVPKFSSSHGNMTITAKQNYIPWHKHFGSSNYCYDPLITGMYVTSITGSEFWGREPSRYPGNPYYFASTKFRINIFIGQRITLDIPSAKRNRLRSVSFFYEISVNELYLIEAFGNSWLKPTDYLHLSLGAKFKIF